MEHFFGVFVNTITVIIGGSLGLLLKKGIPEKLTEVIMSTIGLCTIAIGITGIMKGQNQLVMVISMVLGVVVGSIIDIDGRINSIGEKLNAKFNKGKSGPSITEGFVSASLLFCVGAMTVVGSINAGISADNQMLYTKSLLDFISSTMLGASLGIGVVFSSAFVFVFQGLFVVIAMFAGSFLSEFAIAELICEGSIMIMAIGLNMMGLTKIKVANLMPALIFAPLICMVIPV